MHVPVARVHIASRKNVTLLLMLQHCNPSATKPLGQLVYARPCCCAVNTAGQQATSRSDSFVRVPVLRTRYQVSSINTNVGSSQQQQQLAAAAAGGACRGSISSEAYCSGRAPRATLVLPARAYPSSAQALLRPHKNKRPPARRLPLRNAPARTFRSSTAAVAPTIYQLQYNSFGNGVI